MDDVLFLLKFGKMEHIKNFANNRLFCSNALTLRGIETDLKIKGQGDKLEGSSKVFATHIKLVSYDTGEVIEFNCPTNLIMNIEPANKIPVFCMFAVTSKDCEKTSDGKYRIHLSKNTKDIIRNHFPNADAVAVVKSPDDFICDIKKSIGTEIVYDRVKYFRIDEGYPIEGSNARAGDMEYHKYLMQDEQTETVDGKKRTSFSAKNAYRSLLCKDVFFEGEQEFRIILLNCSIDKGTNFPVTINQEINIYDLDEFFAEN